MTLVLQYAARSDRGLVRSNNQDSVYAGPRLLAVADGMGGHAAGEVASKVVIAAFAPLDEDEPSEDLLAQLRDATYNGNGAISELVANDSELDGMGTTLTAMLFAGGRLGVAHVGDSRAYLLRNGAFTQITHDDSFVQSLIDEGRITPEEANNHPQRSLLLRALTGHEVEPSLTIREARAGDRYLLCSDGLSGFVSHETLTETIRIPDPQACADRLIELALKAGGADNVTCIVADVVDVDFGEDSPIVGGAAGDGSEEAPPGNSPAARAGALTPRPQPQRTPEDDDRPDPAAKRRKRIRGLVAALVVLVLLIAAGGVTAYWVLRQYYVGASPDGEVAIFQGVHGSVLGVSLHRQVEGSCPPGKTACERVNVSDLKPPAQDTVKAGVTGVDGLDGARTYIDEVLRHQSRLPVCPSDPAATTTTTATTPPVSPTTTTKPHAGSTGQPTTTAQRPPASSTTPATTPLRPGVDCRPKVG